MASTIIMPQLGETVAEGKILAWFKSVGDEIKEGDNLFEVETDKVTIEVQAIVAGRLSEIRVGPGVTAKVGEVVAVVDDGAAAKAPARAEAPVTTIAACALTLRGGIDADWKIRVREGAERTTLDAARSSADCAGWARPRRDRDRG